MEIEENPAKLRVGCVAAAFPVSMVKAGGMGNVLVPGAMFCLVLPRSTRMETYLIHSK